jgi:hypothetical protein
MKVKDKAAVIRQWLTEISVNDMRDFTITELRESVRAIDIVIATDRHDHRHNSIMYGRQWLRTVAAGLVGTQRARVGRVAIDFDTDELELLAAICMIEKGCHEYEDNE